VLDESFQKAVPLLLPHPLRSLSSRPELSRGWLGIPVTPSIYFKNHKWFLVFFFVAETARSSLLSSLNPLRPLALFENREHPFSPCPPLRSSRPFSIPIELSISSAAFYSPRGITPPQSPAALTPTPVFFVLALFGTGLPPAPFPSGLADEGA